jgi:hypothetical protein
MGKYTGIHNLLYCLNYLTQLRKLHIQFSGYLRLLFEWANRQKQLVLGFFTKENLCPGRLTLL